MADSNTVLSTNLNLTESAVAKVWQLIQEEDNFNLNLRAYITGGGCSGFQYGFTFDEEINLDDIVVEKFVVDDAQQSACYEDNNQEDKTLVSTTTVEYTKPPNNVNKVVRLIVDSISYQYLIGAEIDYQEDNLGSQFIIRNPNAKTTCGCGSSFSV